jgi:hypothetical protein
MVKSLKSTTMKKNHKYLSFFAVITVTITLGCTKFLDVKPEDKFIQDQVFTNRSSINQVLNGIYMQLASTTLYGRNLTWSTTELLGQRYNTSTSQSPWTVFSNYSYGDQNVMDAFESIWENAYVAILGANNFIESLSKTSGILSEAEKAQLLGEAYGLRAFLHFDLLRLYGPMPANADSVLTSIPYYTRPVAAAEEIIPANRVIDNIIADLRQAEEYLSNDPVRTTGVNPVVLNDGNDFYRTFRNRRMNYYAVKALQARVYLYRNDKASALLAAKAALTGEIYFPWTTFASIYTEKVNPDRIFSNEVLFGIQNPTMYLIHDATFNGAISDAAVLASQPARLAAVFENLEGDYRYTTTWLYPESGKNYRTFFKYADIVDKTILRRMFQPLIRKTELYYIISECEPDKTEQLRVLNQVRFNRGLADLASTVTVNTELQKEYQKEFFGEGQLFFYYKRKGITAIPNGGAASGNITMNAAKYVVPLPLSETITR